MVPPPGPARPLSPHIALKHELLVRYLDVWTPSVLHGAHRVSYAEGYAAVGVTPGREEGSAGAALRVFGEFADRLAGHELAMVLVDTDQGRLDALAERLAGVRAEHGSPPGLTVHTARGTCADDLVPALAGALAAPIFSYLDAAGSPPPPLATVTGVARHRRSELLVVLDPALLARLAAGDEPPETGDALFGDSAWRRGTDYPDLVTSYRHALRHAGLSDVVHAELVAADGAAELLFFGTRSAKNLEKFKAELWAVDEYAGVRYRDPRDDEHELLDVSFSPSLGPLRRALLAAVTSSGSQTVADLRRFTLAETMYTTADANRALGALLSGGALAREPAKGHLGADTVLRPASRAGR